jgi:hypothetical protein
MLKKLILSFMTFLLIFSSSVSASNRSSSGNSLGINLSMLGHPHPTLMGVNLDYALTDRFRIGAGTGSISTTSGAATIKATTTGAKLLFFLTDWNFSPFVGAGYSIVSVTADVSGSTGSVSGLSLGDYSFPYFSFGMDWVSSGGFHLAFGYNKSTNSSVTAVPYVSLGWFLF